MVNKDGAETNECARKETATRKASDQTPHYSRNSILLFSAAQVLHVPAETKGNLDCII